MVSTDEQIQYGDDAQSVIDALDDPYDPADDPSDGNFGD